MKIKQGSLVVCLFLFLFVVIGGGLHLNPGGAFLAATGTPLIIHLFNRRWEAKTVENDPPRSSSGPGSVRRVAETHASHPPAFETDRVLRQ